MSESLLRLRGERGADLEADAESKLPKNALKHSARPYENFRINTSAKTPRAGPHPALIALCPADKARAYSGTFRRLPYLGVLGGDGGDAHVPQPPVQRLPQLRRHDVPSRSAPAAGPGPPTSSVLLQRTGKYIKLALIFAKEQDPTVQTGGIKSLHPT